MKLARLAILLPLLLCGGCFDALLGALSPTAGTGTSQPSLSNPDAALITATDAYTGVISIIDAALQAKLVTGAELQPLLPIRNAARAALARAQLAKAAGNESAAQTAIGEFQAALAQLQPLITLISQRKAGK